MLRSSNPYLRVAGRLLVVGAVAAALPLTASRAVDYVDVPAATQSVQLAHASPSTLPIGVAATQASTSAIASQSAAVPHDAALPSPRSKFDVRTSDGRAMMIAGAPTAAAATFNIVSADGQHFAVRGAPSTDFEIRGDGKTFIINGKTKRWDELTAAEKAQVRAAVANARAALQKAHLDRDQIARDLARVPDQAQLEQMQRDLARTQASVAETVRNLDAHRDEIRRAGMDSSEIEATVAEALKSVQSVDMQAVAREAASIDRVKIAGDLARAEQSMRQARAELDRLQVRMDADRHQ